MADKDNNKKNCSMSSTTSDSESDEISNEWLVMSQSSHSSQTSIIGQITRCWISCPQSGIDCINLLDDYSLLTIFSKLSLIERITAQKVCKKWKQLIDKLIRCQTSIGVTISLAVCEDRKHRVLSDECIGDVFDSAIEGSANTKWYFVNQSNLSLVLSKSPNLKSLILQNCIFCRQVLEVFSTDCSSLLEHLDLSYSSCNVNEILQILSDKCCQTLKHVILEDNEISESGLQFLINSCKELEILILDKNIEITGNCFHLFGHKIKYLSIIGCESIDESGINALVSGNGKQLSHLRIGDSLQPSMFQTICQKMISLKILEFNGFKADATNAHNAYTYISELESLQELVLTVPNIPFDTPFVAIIRRTHDLRKLRIDGAIVTNTALKQLAINCRFIEHISINPSQPSTNGGITDDCCLELGSLSHLKLLSLCGASITDQFVSVISSCPRLKTIELDSCKDITKKSLEIFVETAKSRPNDKIMVYIQRTNILKPSFAIPSNLTVVGIRL